MLAVRRQTWGLFIFDSSYLRLGPPALGGILLISFYDYNFSIVAFISCSGWLLNLFSYKNGDSV